MRNRSFFAARLSAYCARWLILLLPTAMLIVALCREGPPINWMLVIATGFQLVVCILTFFSNRSWQQPLGPSVITLYLIALAWLWIGSVHQDWFIHFSRAVLLIVPLVMFGLNYLAESGATRMRRANLLAERLARRKDWPADMTACRSLPEVKALRAALGYDAAPALVLLAHERLEVRVAALAALEFRKDWRGGQAELVLQTAQASDEPALRAAAIMALGNLDERHLLEMMAEFLRDPLAEVRKAAIEALLWDNERRWPWIRLAVRRLLADPVFYNDGPLAQESQLLCPEAVNDLTAWCTEKGLLSTRAAQTLSAHYNRALSERPEPNLVISIRGQLANPQTPAVLRLELGKLLQQFQELDVPLLLKLLEPSNPAPLRLIACETLLAENATEDIRDNAIRSLRELSRLPNREIALSTADVIQRRLGVDLGLALGQPLPPLQSRQAADIARRVLVWSSQYDARDEELEDSHVVRQ